MATGVESLLSQSCFTTLSVRSGTARLAEKPNPPCDVTGVRFQCEEGGGCRALPFSTLTNDKQVSVCTCVESHKKKSEKENKTSGVYFFTLFVQFGKLIDIECIVNYEGKLFNINLGKGLTKKFFVFFLKKKQVCTFENKWEFILKPNRG